MTARDTGNPPVNERRWSYTTTARIQLAVSPLLMLLLLVLSLCEAVKRALLEFGSTLVSQVRDDCRWWYRDVYRPARHGSVWDD